MHYIDVVTSENFSDMVFCGDGPSWREKEQTLLEQTIAIYLFIVPFKKDNHVTISYQKISFGVRYRIFATHHLEPVMNLQNLHFLMISHFI